MTLYLNSDLYDTGLVFYYSVSLFVITVLFVLQPGQKIDDYWDPGKSLLTEPGKFLEGLFKFDKDNIPDSVIKTIGPYMEDESFQPAAIAKVGRLSYFTS